MLRDVSLKQNGKFFDSKLCFISSTNKIVDLHNGSASIYSQSALQFADMNKLPQHVELPLVTKPRPGVPIISSLSTSFHEDASSEESYDVNYVCPC